jgi:Bacteriophage CI repressor helix-turn-helix domain
MDEPVRVYIERLKAEYRVRTDEELGALLGYSKQAIANWRRRGVIPASVERKLVATIGPRFAVNPALRKLAERRMNAIASACSIMFWHWFISSLKHRPSATTMLSIAAAEESIRAVARDTADQIWDEGDVFVLVELIGDMMIDYTGSRGLAVPTARIEAILSGIDLDGNAFADE